MLHVQLRPTRDRHQNDTRDFAQNDTFAHTDNMAAIAQLGERQTEDLKVPGSIPGLGTCCTRSVMLLVVEGRCCIQAALQLAPAVEMRLASTQKPA